MFKKDYNFPLFRAHPPPSPSSPPSSASSSSSSFSPVPDSGQGDILLAKDMHAQGENVKLTLIHEITREDHITKFLDPVVREGLQDDNVHVVDTYIVGALIAMQHGLLTPLQVAEISALALAELGEISVTRYRKKQGLENRYFFLFSIYD